MNKEERNLLEYLKNINKGSKEIMTKKIFELEWDDKDLGDEWMNIYNLELCLYSKEHTRRDLITVREIVDDEDKEE